MNRTTKQILESIEHLDQLKAELEAKKAEKERNKKTARPLNYRFYPTCKDDIKRITDRFHGSFNESDVARAAIMIGLQEIERLQSENMQQAKGLLHIQKLKVQLQK